MPLLAAVLGVDPLRRVWCSPRQIEFCRTNCVMYNPKIVAFQNKWRVVAQRLWVAKRKINDKVKIIIPTANSVSKIATQAMATHANFLSFIIIIITKALIVISNITIVGCTSAVVVAKRLLCNRCVVSGRTFCSWSLPHHLPHHINVTSNWMMPCKFHPFNLVWDSQTSPTPLAATTQKTNRPGGGFQFARVEPSLAHYYFWLLLLLM